MHSPASHAALRLISYAARRGLAAAQDIEGGEWAAFDDLFAAALMPYSELLIELHIPNLPERWGESLHQRLRRDKKHIACTCVSHVQFALPDLKHCNAADECHVCCKIRLSKTPFACQMYPQAVGIC